MYLSFLVAIILFVSTSTFLDLKKVGVLVGFAVGVVCFEPVLVALTGLRTGLYTTLATYTFFAGSSVMLPFLFAAVIAGVVILLSSS